MLLGERAFEQFQASSQQCKLERHNGQDSLFSPSQKTEFEETIKNKLF
jgi:hypothetical protein